MKEFIGSDAQLLAGYSRYRRPPARCHQDVSGAIADIVDAYGMSIFNGDIAVHPIDTGAIKNLAIDLVQTRNFLVLGCNQGAPIMRGRADLPAEAARIGKIFMKMGTIGHQFFRDATDIDAGAAPVPALGDRYARTVLRRESAGAYATGATADSKQVVIVLLHMRLFAGLMWRMPASTETAPPRPSSLPDTPATRAGPVHRRVSN